MATTTQETPMLIAHTLKSESLYRLATAVSEAAALLWSEQTSGTLYPCPICGHLSCGLMGPATCGIESLSYDEVIALFAR